MLSNLVYPSGLELSSWSFPSIFCVAFSWVPSPLPSASHVRTIAPAIILIFIAIPSLRLLYLIDEINNPVVTLKTIGHQ